MKIALIFKEIVLGSRISNINEMIRNRLAINNIIGKIFSCSYIHSTINLSRIGTNDLASHVGS